jgi:phosphotransferase system HPr-like phosphotransfer protein
MKNALMIFGLVGLMATAPAMVAAKDVSESREAVDSVSSFCRDRVKVLRGAYRQAEIESQAGNHAVSATILEKALRTAASQITPRYASTITSKAIKRGVVLLTSLKAAPETRQKVRTINNFLFNYFVFIEDVSNRLDVPYFQPAHGGFGHITASNTKFEKLLVNFAQEQVSMVLNTMSTTANEGRTEVIYPIGSPTLLLTALKVTTASMANDLSDSIFAPRYACMIEDLTIASEEIATYLKTKNTYADEYVAVQELVGAVKRATAGSRGCDSENGYEAQETRTSDAISGPFTLQSGTTQQVRLNGTRYIKKLIISAEGIRSDAMFDVVVNGDVKGTVYVPGRDPSYFVTIEDSADSIEFVSRNGTAIISRILVINE